MSKTNNPNSNRVDNKTFQSNVFSGNTNNDLRNSRVNNNMKGNDIFNAGE